MARVPESQQIIAETFKKEEQELVQKIADPFNTYTEQLNGILTNNLTFTDNFLGSVKSFQLQGEQSIAFKYDFTEKPIGLWIVAFSNLSDTSEVLTSGVSAQWLYDGKGTITINRIAGLTTGKTYLVTLIIISG